MPKAKYEVINLSDNSTTSFGPYKKGQAVYKNGDIVEFEKEFAQNFIQFCDVTKKHLGLLKEAKVKAGE